MAPNLNWITDKMKNRCLDNISECVGMSRTNSSYSSNSSRWQRKHRSKDETFSYKKCLIVFLPLTVFLLLGIYLILVDLEIISSLLGRSEKKNTSEIIWSDVPTVEEIEELDNRFREKEHPQQFIPINKEIAITKTKNKFIASPDIFEPENRTDKHVNNNVTSVFNEKITKTEPNATNNQTFDKIPLKIDKNIITTNLNQTGGTISLKTRTNISTTNLNPTGDKISLKTKEIVQQRNLTNTPTKLINRTVVLLEKVENRTKFVIFNQSNASPKEFLKIVKPPNFNNASRVGSSGFTFGPIIVQNINTTSDLVYGARKSYVARPSTTPVYQQKYYPTVPIVGKQKTETTTYQSTQDECFSTRLKFCEGVLPYDIVKLPDILNVKTYEDLKAMLPYFQMIVASNCSHRVREFICVILEPQCQPIGYLPTLPCRANCKVLVEQCKDYMLETLDLSKVFDCKNYPDWHQNGDCLNLAKGSCLSDEFRCPDGTCIPKKWVCDGVNDCPGNKPSSDELRCQGCSEQEFRCTMDGKCIPKHWKCDGTSDCLDESDELTCS